MTRRSRSTRSTFRELLQDNTKKMDSSENIPAHLVRDMLLTHGISPAQWDKMADQYYRQVNTNSKGQVDLLKVTHDKSNMAKALAKDTLPWRRCESTIQILGPVSYKISVELTFANGVTYKHEVFKRNKYYEPDAIEGDDDESKDDDDE